MPDGEKEVYSDFCLLKRDVSVLMKDWFGNGKKGYKIEVIEMKKDFENHKKLITSKLKVNTTMTTLVFIALIGNLIRSFF